MSSGGVKQEAHRLVDDLPDNATWDDLKVPHICPTSHCSGLKDFDAGRTLDVKEVRRGLAKTC